MKESRYQWQEETDTIKSEGLFPALKELGLSNDLAPLLWKRGVKQVEDVASFFYPALENLHDPFLLYDMEKAVERIQTAIMNNEKILVYGDYDADGITSTSLMKESLELVGANVSYFIPNRFDDGYGPNKEVYKYYMKQEQVTLIITVDNGVSGHEAIQYAQENNVDVIVTDHHELPEVLPNAYAIIHPRHPLGEYPFGDLAGVGVAFKLSSALLGEIPIDALDLVAIGTIADLVSLTDENRALVKLGLDRLKETDRIGLQIMFSETKVNLTELNEETVGFTIGPRLNAIGRLGDGSPGVELLTTFDDEAAEQIVRDVEASNDERKEIVQRISGEALLMAEQESSDFNLIIKEGWHQGVLGIVASKVVQKMGRPTLIMTYDEQTGLIKGSGRSTEHLDMFQFLTQMKDKFVSFGGHHMACGLSFEKDKVESIREAIKTQLAAGEYDFSQKPALAIDENLAIDQITVKKIEQLNQLRPFGTDNPAPYFKIDPETMTSMKRLGVNQDHLKLLVRSGETDLDCIGFSFGDALEEIESGSGLSLVGQVSINEWNGQRKPQFQITDYCVNGIQIFDARGKKAQNFELSKNDICGLVFTQPFYDKFSKTMNVQLFDVEKSDSLDTYQTIAILECPPSLEVAEKMAVTYDVSRWVLLCETDFDHYLTGIPTRDDFGKLFKLIHQQSSIDVRHKLDAIISYLKIDKNKVIFMIKVFFELGFVTIEDGLMKRVENPPHRPLTESTKYQAYLKKIESEKLFICSNTGEIKQWLCSIGGNKK